MAAWTSMRASLPAVATSRVVYTALHRPLTIAGVERRQFFVALLLGAALFNLSTSLVVGVIAFVGLYVAGLWATRRDPEMLRILIASLRTRRRYDPGKHDRVDLEAVAW